MYRIMTLVSQYVSYRDMINDTRHYSRPTLYLQQVSDHGETSLAAQHRNLVSALTKRQAATSSASPGSSDSPPSPQFIVCGWCQKPGLKLFTLKTSSGTKPFCSELCFTQCRRASFKKNKICDWCKHVRHTVNYVEYVDGEIQFQFCSEKCLSQYKMNIFCRETQEHLNKIKSSDSEENNNCDSKEKKILITPDLWLQEQSDNRKEFKDLCDSGDDKDIPRKSGLSDRSSTRTKSETNHRHQIRTHQSRSNAETKYLSDSPLKKSRTQHDSKEAQRSKSPPKTSPKPTPIPGLPTGPFLPPWIPPHLMSGFGHGMMNHPFLYGMPPFGQPFPMSGSSDNRSESRGPSTPHGQNSLSPSTSVCSSDSQSASQNLGLSSTPRNNAPPPPLLPVGYPPLPFPHLNPGENPFGAGVFPLPPQHPLLSNPVMPSGTPPVTVMVPFPVVLPVPVPIPLPLPITAEKLEKFFKEKADEEKQTKVQSPIMLSRDRLENNRSKSAEPSRASSINKKERHQDDCLQCATCTSDSTRTHSRNSVDIGQAAQINSIRDIYSHSVKRSLTQNVSPTNFTLKKPKLEMRSDTDGAIDLSKDSMRNFTGKENREVSVKSEDIKHISDKVENEYMLKVPKIHIVSNENSSNVEPVLPLPPSDTNYSSRRSLILDAPNVPKREQSPSPERRYVRTVSRDMVEAARRRCLRARVKTK
ncbi:hypothetical protein LOTGIDRAFT_154206 [Lottia gigantea]|uniref:Uncharacterized protein n=1 Tax=Lottia gigantea TaxID=225164 RepID=V3ZDD4_LOTGI|nr:hypothetical protein LOTGIDRAFT_154206 [Lottia gigantea]ESO89123.1 hypothetical protein LOTGIDRAFT_154206 [Lottia gigantea]